MPPTLSWFPLLVFALAPTAAAQGDLAKIAVKAKSLLPQPRLQSTLIELEVQNRGALACEPTLFSARWKNAGGEVQERLVERVPLPRVDRAGRSVPPQKKLAYWISVPSEETLELEVALREALFHAKSPADRAPVIVGAVLETHAEHEGERMQTCSIALENTLDVPVDVVLRARCSFPRDGDTLLTASLRAGAKGAFPFRAQPTMLGWNDGDPHFVGLRVSSVELVDWSARAPADAEAARELLLPAYRAWLRWEEGRPPLRGRYRYEARSVYDPQHQSDEGSFTIDASGAISTSSTRGGSFALGPRELEGALYDLLRLSADELARENALVRVAPLEVRIDGPGRGRRLRNPGEHETEGLGAEEAALRMPRPTFPILRVHEGRICGERHDGAGEGDPWTPRSLASGYVIAERSYAGGARTESYAYDLLGDLPVLLRYAYRARHANGETLQEKVLLLDRWELTVDEQREQPQVPTGPAAELLRRHWERLYRYPEGPCDLRARFAAENPGTDDTWVGERKVSGSLVIHGFRGFRSKRSSWDDLDIALDGERASDRSAAIAFGFTDRLVMWKGRDPAALEDFDVLFRGAAITWDESAGRFSITGSTVKSVHVKGERITALVFRGEGLSRITWTEQDGRLLATKIQTGEETLSAQWKKVADGWYLPVKVEFQRVFGRDWGPERYELLGASILSR
ncbi:MAG: hypothetical protein IPN34_18225 [Planctomycetes bacterium]|nr:hypothetical protein [Planctomycetota bacterium]